MPKACRSKRGKSLIIVEGKDEIFIKSLVIFFCRNRDYDIKPTVPGGHKCKILDQKHMQRITEDAIEDGYRQIFILIDLKTQEPNTKRYFRNCQELKNYYVSTILQGNLYNDKIKVVIVIKEIECWLLLAFYNANTESLDSCYKKLKKALTSKVKLTQTQIAERITVKREYINQIVDNRNFNRSFQYFLDKTDLI